MPYTPPRPLYIFDIDGTLCNIEHRLHFLEDKKDSRRWDKFYKACVSDLPNAPVIQTMHALWNNGAEIWLFSGRSEDVRGETVEWLLNNTSLPNWLFEIYPQFLSMRPSKDYTEDHLLKESWLENMMHDDLDRLVAVFDDRKRVVDMWRSHGVACFQVAQGDF